MEVKYRAGESVFTVQGLNLSSIDSAPTGKCSSVGRIEGVGIQNSLFLVWWPRSLELDTSLPLGPEKRMAPHSSTLVWKTPWTEEPGGLQSRDSRRVRQD